MAKIHTVIWTLIPFDNLSPQALCRQIIINSSARSWTRNFSFSCKRHSTFTKALTFANTPVANPAYFPLWNESVFTEPSGVLSH